MDNYYQGCAGAIMPYAISEFPFEKGLYIAEEKYDGIWCNMVFDGNGDVTLWSRNVKEKDNQQLVSLREYAKNTLKLKNTMLIGELDFSTQKGTDFAREYGHHRIHIYDMLTYNGTQYHTKPVLERRAALKDLLNGVDPLWIEEAWFMEAKDGKIIQAKYNDIVSKGGEGLIIKDLRDEQYRFGGKSKLWYKIKKQVAQDYVIMGYTETKSADFAQRGWIGGVVGGLYIDGQLAERVTVGSMTFEWREEFSNNGDFWIGKVMEVAGFEIFKSGSMRHPSFLSIRPDKRPEECIW